MPQLDLVTAKSVPFGVRLELRVDPLEPQTTITEVRVFGPENDVIASTGGLWTGIMTDHLPDLARAVSASDFDGQSDVKVEASSMMPMPLDDETVAELEQRLEVGDIDEEYFKDHVTWYVYVKAHKLHQTPERVFAVVPTDVNFAHNGFEYCVTSVREVTVVDPKKQTSQPR